MVPSLITEKINSYSSYNENDANQNHMNNGEKNITNDFINHELSVNLDSSNAFEGPEKLLEIWISPTESILPIGCPEKGLRAIPLEGIEQLLDLVNCKILSKISTNELDAYLLSESSLFVYTNRLVLKTCGTTATLLCLSKLQELIIDHLSWPNDNVLKNIYRIFYSRRSFMFPDRQTEIHQSWSNELTWLNKYFPSSTSKAYVVGDLSHDHWYLYINGVNTQQSNKSSPATSLVSSPRSNLNLENNHHHIRNDNINYPISPLVSPKDSIPQFLANRIARENYDGFQMDDSLELLMTELDSESASNFQLSKHQNEFPSMDPAHEDYGHLLGNKMMQTTGLDSIFDRMDVNSLKHDAFAFTPCGFSSNSIINEKYYYTLHITPEQGWSYASFETNLPNRNQSFLVNNVIKILKPNKFCLVFVRENLSNSENCLDNLIKFDLDDYTRVDKIVYDLKYDYKLLYSYFEKN
ncbi:lyase activity protein [[Candida] boidinii]|nr:lyase activity protein [[Candida] boidinii]OWB64665.1 lyase activity protein [[Candida] boidinii]OWB71718.1 lyase activity protein [[Candida] boidinii]